MPVIPNTKIVDTNTVTVIAVWSKRNCFINVLENVDIPRFISMFCQKKTVSNATCGYSADKLVTENHF